MGGHQSIQDSVLNLSGAGLFLGPSEPTGAQTVGTRKEEDAEEDEAKEADWIDNRDPGA